MPVNAARGQVNPLDLMFVQTKVGSKVGVTGKTMTQFLFHINLFDQTFLNTFLVNSKIRIKKVTKYETISITNNEPTTW